MEDLSNWIVETGLDRLVFATDMDMTLLDKIHDPENIMPDTALEDDCRQIDALTNGRFFIVTGRDIEFVDFEIFKNHKVKISAEYNCMARYDVNAGNQELVTKPQWELIDDDLKALLAERPDWKLRIKPFMRSFHHYLPPEDQAAKEELRENLQALVDKLCDATGQALEVVDGGPIFDLKPRGPDKAQALEDILSFCSFGYNGTQPLVPIYFGDSPGDLPAAKTAQEQGGVFVAVGDDPRVTSVADFHLQDPAQYRALLHKIARDSKLPAAQPPSVTEPATPENH